MILRRQGLLGQVVHQGGEGGNVLQTEPALRGIPAGELGRRQVEDADKPCEQVRVVAHRLARDHRHILVRAPPVS